MPKVLVLFGSSRSDGSTRKAIDAVIQGQQVEFIDLAEHSIHPYDYEYRFEDDDFLDIAKKMVEADTIIFTTPVYWYSMSSQLKTFVDRFSDLVRVHKDIGRSLAGKKCYLVSSGYGAELPEGYEVPFDLTCKYLDMQYCGSFYYSSENEELTETEQDKARELSQKIFSI